MMTTGQIIILVVLTVMASSAFIGCVFSKKEGNKNFWAILGIYAFGFMLVAAYTAIISLNNTKSELNEANEQLKHKCPEYTRIDAYVPKK